LEPRGDWASGSVDPANTIACVGMLAAIAETVPYPHMHLLVETHGQPGCVSSRSNLSMASSSAAARREAAIVVPVKFVETVAEMTGNFRCGRELAGDPDAIVTQIPSRGGLRRLEMLPQHPRRCSSLI
jgi:hypothetical protein